MQIRYLQGLSHGGRAFGRGSNAGACVLPGFEQPDFRGNVLFRRNRMRLCQRPIIGDRQGHAVHRIQVQ
jgi:hypothetical protein